MEVKTETLLEQGKRYHIQYEYAYMHKVYFSYRDSLVGILEFENIYQWANDYINHIYVDKINDTLSIQYIGRESEIDERKGFKSTPAIPLKEYIKSKGITEKDRKAEFKKRFFEFYDPEKSKFVPYIKE